MPIVFYQAPMSSASPVAVALAELDVRHESVKVDLSAGDQKKPEFLKLNPNGKVPTMVVDGTPMFEALAIMLFLSEKYGVEKKLWPAANDPARLEAMSWSTWAYVTFGPVVHRHQFAASPRGPAELHNPAWAEHARKEAASLFAILDARLADKPYILGASYSMVDLIVGGLVGYASMTGLSLAESPHVRAWIERVQARPAFRTAMAAR
ncbi:MAG TPA: glutathione S-transferase family protein [Polyangiaceae bacterium]|nr:glutathione S-transferase family protein [Polyangiaceae bacterium]